MKISMFTDVIYDNHMTKFILKIKTSFETCFDADKRYIHRCTNIIIITVKINNNMEEESCHN